MACTMAGRIGVTAFNIVKQMGEEMQQLIEKPIVLENPLIVELGSIFNMVIGQSEYGFKRNGLQQRIVHLITVVKQSPGDSVNLCENLSKINKTGHYYLLSKEGKVELEKLTDLVCSTMPMLARVCSPKKFEARTRSKEETDYLIKKLRSVIDVLFSDKDDPVKQDIFYCGISSLRKDLEDKPANFHWETLEKLLIIESTVLNIFKLKKRPKSPIVQSQVTFPVMKRLSSYCERDLTSIDLTTPILETSFISKPKVSSSPSLLARDVPEPFSLSVNSPDPKRVSLTPPPSKPSASHLDPFLGLYRNNLKNRNFEIEPTLSKADSSSCFGITSSSTSLDDVSISFPKEFTNLVWLSKLSMFVGDIIKNQAASSAIVIKDQARKRSIQANPMQKPRAPHSKKRKAAPTTSVD